VHRAQLCVFHFHWVQGSPLPPAAQAINLSAYLFFRAFFLDSRVFACSLDFFRLRRRLISFCRSLAI
jgi:hypothetical protein